MTQHVKLSGQAGGGARGGGTPSYAKGEEREEGERLLVGKGGGVRGGNALVGKKGGGARGGGTPPRINKLPLCVDLDGTLIANDTTWAAVRLFVRQRRWQIPLLLAWLLRGRAYLKQQLAVYVQLDVASLPYNHAVLQLIAAYRQRGNPIYLVTATDQQVAQQVCAHLNCFTDCYASDGVRNLRHKAKAALLCKTFGTRNFIYIGNSRDDLAVWQQAHSAIVVSNSARLIATAGKISNVVGVVA